MEVAMRRFLVGLVISLLLLVPAMAADVPNGTVELSGGSVALGIGYSWGSGKLVYQGQTYPLKVEGISIVNVGASSYTATGTVYHLKKLEDFNGTYTAGTAGATVAGGVSGTIMRNQNGVAIEMTATHQGLQFTLAPEGVKISIVK
jgi:opacity protein-like surface antigen